MAQQLSSGGFFLRLLFAVLLVFGTYNPSGYSFWHLVVLQFQEINAVRALFGIVLTIGWAVYLRATFRSLGMLGTILAGALFAVLVWLLMDLNVLPKDNRLVWIWTSLAGTAFVLAIGMSWSHIRRRLSGQIDDTDEDA